MELLFVIVIAAGIGGAVRYLIPQRGTYGLLLLPAVGAITAAVVWVGTLWAVRWTFDGTWIWVASLGAAFLVSLALALVLPRRRIEHDARTLQQLSGGKA
ncbi:MAG: hypothetical protein BGO97_01970 [Micrococcales bacterium 70-64]|nr:hypothetical protein [Leifsonia sp.]ODU65973.1 MAG: hypothetical protein ABT06_01975 [Leifsonia sp. SCN 70-46]OJX84599.1 MAG: hypothetical protein BGO97_01970 [Micrococcales bacterium 70-64]